MTNRIQYRYRDPIERAHVGFGCGEAMRKILMQDGAEKNKHMLNRVNILANRDARILQNANVPISEWGLPQCQGK
jgi:hypothetical protein